MDFIQVVLTLFFVLNVFGNAPSILSLLTPYPPKRQQFIIIREFLIALGLLFIFGFYGESVLGFFGISPPIFGIAGGILLFIISLTMIFPKHETETFTPKDLIFAPIAIPMIAGPGTITSVLVFSKRLNSSVFFISAILVSWLASLVVMLFAVNLRRFLGEKGLMACERFGGMIIALIAVEMFLSGTIEYIKYKFPVLMGG